MDQDSKLPKGHTSVPTGDGTFTLFSEAFQEACLAQTCHVVDVREPNEYAAGHIPHAQNHPLSSFDPSKLPTGKPVVLVCQAGGRSARAMAQAHAHGRTDVIHYLPGTGGWLAQGGPVAM
jgi:rhodanese-related sulfurtransferase